MKTNFLVLRFRDLHLRESRRGSSARSFLLPKVTCRAGCLSTVQKISLHPFADISLKNYFFQDVGQTQKAMDGTIFENLQ